MSAATANIPASCLVCHGASSTKAPPFAGLMHLVHLTGGDANVYMGHYQGDCTHCHKMNAQNGQWKIPSAKEPQAD